MSQWSEFYVKRVNSSYQDYFENKYNRMLSTLTNYDTVCEEGIGIGSISKFLTKRGIQTGGIDLCPEMVRLCQLNNPGIKVSQGDMFKHEARTDIVVTHGVLEHFPDQQIHTILDKYKAQNQRNMHYVPLIGYQKPSFGDERLLELEYWLDNFKPDWYFSFNEDKDLILFFNN